MERGSGLPFIFGTQYYRAPSPHPSVWETDLKAIADLGFTTVKYWVQWRWNTPAEGEYRFDDIDRLMDLASKVGLRAMLNTIVDVAPVWIYQKYPDASMLTLDGRRIGPQVQPHRQIGGLGLCFNHAAAQQHLDEFLRTTVRRYRAHPALELWNVASEPEITSSMAEIRLYAADAGRTGDMLCYCDHCRTAFRTWLGERYGDIGVLNIRWNRNYRSFDAVEVPLTRNGLNDVVDWRMFFADTLARHVRRRFDVARAEDTSHPMMCHHVFLQGFPVTSTGSDPWSFGSLGDLHGCTQMDDPMMTDVLRSCARGKPVISAEMLMLFGYTLDLPAPVAADDVKRYIFTGLASNLKGFVFWQYRPETLAREAPAWGLTRLDGAPTPWLMAFADVGKTLQAHANFLRDSRPRPADAAVLYHPENQVFGWAATGSEQTVTESIRGTHRALYEDNATVDLFHAVKDLAYLDEYRVLIIPFPYWLGREFCDALVPWVEAGGVLIGEAYFAGWDPEHGAHQTTVPGYGLEQLFKARQGAAYPLGSRETMRLTRSLPGLPAGTSISGSLVREVLLAEGADVLARWPDGTAAVTSAKRGKGTAILIGSYAGLSHFHDRSRRAGDLLAALVRAYAPSTRPSYRGTGRVRIDLLSHGTERMLILRNLDAGKASGTVTLPRETLKVMKEIFSGRRLQMRPSASGRSARVVLKGGQVLVYHGG